MDASSAALLVVLTAVAVYFGHQTYQSYSGANYRRRLMENIQGPEDIEREVREHTKEFKTDVIKVTDKIYMAVGFALGNSIMVDAPEGLIIVDTTESMSSAKIILREFRKISKKPIKVIFYTHQHPDHTWGTKAFIEDPENPPTIWAHKSTPKELNTFLTLGSEARMIRAYRMFGNSMDKLLISSGLGPKVEIKDSGDSFGLVYPTRFLIGDKEETKMAGLDVVVYRIPGETSDQIGLWIPRDRAFCSGDDIYRAFPNIYTIRGATARDALEWYRSLDLILDHEPEHLVPSHHKPISGRENIRNVLTAYRDGIQYVHDQTVRYMNKGMTPDDIANIVQLPDHLRKHPYLREFYGTVFWSVKGVFDKYLGWFSGDPVDLYPLPKEDKAKKMVELAGGIDKVLDTAQKSLTIKDFQWALELSSHVLAIDNGNERARNIKVEALTSLSGRQLSPNGRNYYMTCALEESAEVKVDIGSKQTADIIKFLPLKEIFLVMTMRFKPEECGDQTTTAFFEFTDTKETITLQLRNHVAVLQTKPISNWDIKVKTRADIWKAVLISKFEALSAYAKGDLTIEGGVLNLKSFLSCFEQ